MRGTPYRLIDLYAGAGGFALGFSEDPRFRVVWANEMDEHAAQTYRMNFGEEVTVGRLEEVLEEVELPEADIVIGGPPCQGFSMLNQSSSKTGDDRRQLWRPYLETVERSGARVFVMENVPPLLRSREYRDFQGIARGMGFTVGAAELCAADYGAPTSRTRAIVFGVKGASLMGLLPPPKSKVRLTLRDAIGDLPERVEATERQPGGPPLDLHYLARQFEELTLERVRSVPYGGNWSDIPEELWPAAWNGTLGGHIYGRLTWEDPVPTIHTMYSNPTTGRVLHPTEDRCLTLREIARAQSFPDWFMFTGPLTSILRQIGNAVPPKLAEAIARTALEILDRAD